MQWIIDNGQLIINMIIRKATSIDPKDLIFITVGKRSATYGFK